MIALLLTAAALAQNPPTQGMAPPAGTTQTPASPGNPQAKGGGQGGQGGQPPQGGQAGQPPQGGQGGQAGQPPQGGQGGQAGQPPQGGQGGQAGQPPPGGQSGQPGQPAGAEPTEPGVVTEPQGLEKYGAPFILRIKDPLKLLEEAPTARIGEGADALDVTVVDDGVSPDIKADDHVYTGLVDLYPAKTNRILLVQGDKELLNFTFKIDKTARDPAVEVDLKPGGGKILSLIDDGNADLQATVATTEMRSPNQNQSMPGGGGQTPGGMEGGASVTLLSIGVFLAGGLLGGAISWLRLRAGPAGRVRPIGPGPSYTGDAGDPSGRGVAQIWVAPREDAGLAAAAARWASAWGPVLVLPDPARRGPLAALGQDNPHLYWLPDDQPEPAEALSARDALRGEAAIVVDGLAALVPPGPTESATAPADELCAVPNIILVVGPDTALPAGLPVFHFQQTAAGFRVEGGALVLPLA